MCSSSSFFAQGKKRRVDKKIKRKEFAMATHCLLKKKIRQVVVPRAILVVFFLFFVFPFFNSLQTGMLMEEVSPSMFRVRGVFASVLISEAKEKKENTSCVPKLIWEAKGGHKIFSHCPQKAEKPKKATGWYFVVGLKAALIGPGRFGFESEKNLPPRQMKDESIFVFFGRAAAEEYAKERFRGINLQSVKFLPINEDNFRIYILERTNDGRPCPNKFSARIPHPPPKEEVKIEEEE